jgi:hypothetical protein
VFEGLNPHVTPELLDLAWGNYFGMAHGFVANENGHHNGQTGQQPHQQAA